MLTTPAPLRQGPCKHACPYILLPLHQPSLQCIIVQDLSTPVVGHLVLSSSAFLQPVPWADDPPSTLKTLPGPFPLAYIQRCGAKMHAHIPLVMGLALCLAICWIAGPLACPHMHWCSRFGLQHRFPALHAWGGPLPSCLILSVLLPCIHSLCYKCPCKLLDVTMLLVQHSASSRYSITRYFHVTVCLTLPWPCFRLDLPCQPLLLIMMNPNNHHVLLSAFK